MSFTDIIKKSVIDGFSASDLGTTVIVIYLSISLLLGLYIYFIYRISARNGFYSSSFSKSVACLPVITTGIILAMQSNLIISLGMVGALSIVRFRNAVKDPVDLMFLFWSISIGIIIGAKLFELAIILCLCLTVLVFALDLLPSLRVPFILVVSGETTLEESLLLSCVRTAATKCRVRSRNNSCSSSEWIIELQTKDPAKLMKSVAELHGIRSFNLLSHDGEVRS